MSFTLKLVFSGLIAFIPNTKSPPDEIYVLLVNALNNHDVIHGSHALIHRPSLEFSCANLADPTAQVMCNSLPLSPRFPPAEGVRYIGLEHEYEVSIKVGGSPLPRHKLKLSESFFRLVDMKALVPSSTHIRKELVAPCEHEVCPGSVQKSLVGRIFISAGEVGEFSGTTPQDDHWSFQTRNGFVVAQKNNIPYEIEASIPVNASEVTVSFVGLDGTNRFEIRFKPVLGEDVVLRIVNEPNLADYCAREKEAGMFHFTAFYSLLDNKLPDSQLAVPVSPFRERRCSSSAKTFFEALERSDHTGVELALKRSGDQQAEQILNRRLKGGGKYPIICMSPLMASGDF